MNQEPELKLPNDILQIAIRSGNEFGWKKNDIINAIEAAKNTGLATIGGQVQFVFPDGTCELYWIEYDSDEIGNNEEWESYVQRTASECISKLKSILSTYDLIEEGKKHFEFLKKKEEAGFDLNNHLIFIVYFDEKESAEPVA